MTPNIFRYATKELSQDAVICWLVACGKEAKGTLKKCGLAFIEALMRSGNGAVIDRDLGRVHHQGQFDVTDVVGEIKRQDDNVDVYFRANVDGQTIGFLIEDKKDTEMHGDQLKRYLKDKIDSSAERGIQTWKAVYFKTGFIFDDERNIASDANWSVFCAEDILQFLQDSNRMAAHVFIGDFTNYIEEVVTRRNRALKEWDLNFDFVQWEFMVRLHDEIKFGDSQWPARARNVGGGAWTQYPHWEKRGALYWRLDSWKPLRLMVDTGKVRGDVLALWNKWHEIFDLARKESGLPEGKFRRRRMSRGKLVREGTIGAIDVRSCLQSEGRDRCMERVRILHNRFIAMAGPELI